MEKSSNLWELSLNEVTVVDDKKVNVNSKKELEKNIFGHKSSALIDQFIVHYKHRNDHNRVLRILFFSFSFFMLLAVIASFTTFIILVACKGDINVEAAVSIASICVTVLTSLLVLPKMVGKNLFPDTEDNEILTFVREMNKTELEFAKIEVNSTDSETTH